MTFLEWILSRKRSGKLQTGKGTGFASDYVRTLIEAAGSEDRLNAFLACYDLASLEKSIKGAESRLVYCDEAMGVLGGQTPERVFGEKSLRKDASVIPPHSLMVCEYVATSRRKDRDRDILLPKGAKIDAKMPFLWQHMSEMPIGPFMEELFRDDDKLILCSAISQTKIGVDAMILVEAGALRISHGFNPLEFEPNDSEKSDDGWLVKSYEMMETSLVSIPSNTDAVITSFSRNKLHHPVVKLWAGHLFDSRSSMVKGGWGGEQPVINVTVNLGDHVKSDKQKKEEDPVVPGAGANDKPEGDKPDEPKPEEPTKDASEILTEIASMVAELGKNKNLTGEAAARVQVVLGMVEDAQASMTKYAEDLKVAADSTDLAKILEHVNGLVTEVIGKLSRLGGELTTIAGLDGIDPSAGETIKAIIDRVGDITSALNGVTGVDPSVDPNGADTGGDMGPVSGDETKADCPTCGGTGINWEADEAAGESIDCPDCNGTGQKSNSETKSECPECSGGGMCSGCWGNGRVMDEQTGTFRPCTLCDGSGKCHYCGGTGQKGEDKFPGNNPPSYVCPVCGNANNPGDMACSMCGAALVGNERSETKDGDECPVCHGMGQTDGLDGGDPVVCEACEGTGIRTEAKNKDVDLECWRCGNEGAAFKLPAHPDGGGVICDDCYKLIGGKDWSDLEGYTIRQESNGTWSIYYYGELDEGGFADRPSAANALATMTHASAEDVQEKGPTGSQEDPDPEDVAVAFSAGRISEDDARSRLARMRLSPQEIEDLINQYRSLESIIGKGKKGRPKAANVPDVRQESDFDCGPAATLSVCKYRKVGPDSEDELIGILGTSQADGTSPHKIIGYLQSLGLKVEAKDGMEIPDLKAAVDAGSPVIVCVQDYEGAPADVANEKAGHYVVVCDVTDDMSEGMVVIHDPSAGRITLPAQTFLARWQDKDTEHDHVHFGIVVGAAGQKGSGKGVIMCPQCRNAVSVTPGGYGPDEIIWGSLTCPHCGFKFHDDDVAEAYGGDYRGRFLDVCDCKACDGKGSCPVCDGKDSKCFYCEGSFRCAGCEGLGIVIGKESV